MDERSSLVRPDADATRRPSAAAPPRLPDAAPFLDEAALRALLALTPQFVWEADVHGLITQANDWAIAYLGRGIEQMRGERWLEVVHPAHHARVKQAWAQSLAAGTPYEVEMPVLRADGAWRWHLVRAAPVRGVGGFIERWVGLALDIHEMKLREQDLRERELQWKLALDAARQADGRLQALGEATPSFLYMKDRESRMIWCNPAVPEALGTPMEEIVGRTDAEFLRDKVRAAEILAHDAEVMTTGRTSVLEERLGDPDRVYISTKTPWRNGAGEVVGLVGVSLDVTAQRHAEEALADSQDRLRLAAESVGMGLYEWDIERDALSWSDTLRRQFGVDLDSVVTLETAISRIHPDDRETVRAAVAAACDPAGDGRYDLVYRTVPVDGELRWLHVLGQVRFEERDGARRATRFLGVSLDVTGSRRLQEQVRESEERLRLVLEATGAGTFDLNLRTGSLRWDARTREIFGLGPDEPVDLARFMTLLHPTERERMAALIARITGPDSDGRFHTSYRIVRPDGGTRIVEAKGRVHFEGTGAARQATRFVGQAMDITEQRALEQALADSRERFQLAVASSSLSTFEWDIERDLVRWSPQGRVLFGFDSDAPRPIRTAVERIHAEDRPMVQAAIERAMADPDDPEYRAQYRVVRPDGSVRWVDAAGRVRFQPDAHGRPRAVRFTGVLWDITDSRELVEALRDADRRKDEFLAMLAHELRNPLAPVLNAVRLLERRNDLDDGGRQALRMIDRQVRHMKRLVDDLLEVSRITRGKIALQPEPMELQAAVASAVDAVRPAVQRRGQSLTLALPDRPVRLVADPVRVVQILENLLTNASKYTPERGTIRVEVHAPPPAAHGVEIRVIDDGMGIAADQLEAVFDLFTQVEPDLGRSQGGLGIGLALVRRLVTMHGGTVHAESAGRGKGATFVVRLPGRLPD